MNISLDYPLQSLFNSINQSVVCLDISCNVMLFNSRAQNRIRIYRKIRICVGDNFQDYLCKSTKERFDHYFHFALKGQQSDIEVQLPLGESYVWHSIGFFPIFNDNGKVCGVSFVFKDIHEKKLNELENVAYIETLQNIAWRQSHLFRAPVANIKGLSELLMLQNDKNLDSNLGELLMLLRTEVDKLDKEIHSIVGLTSNIKIVKIFRN